MPQKSTERPCANTSGTDFPAAASISSFVGLGLTAIATAPAPAPAQCPTKRCRYSDELANPLTIVRKSAGLAFR